MIDDKGQKFSMITGELIAADRNHNILQPFIPLFRDCSRCL